MSTPARYFSMEKAQTDGGLIGDWLIEGPLYLQNYLSVFCLFFGFM